MLLVGLVTLPMCFRGRFCVPDSRKRDICRMFHHWPLPIYGILGVGQCLTGFGPWSVSGSRLSA